MNASIAQLQFEEIRPPDLVMQAAQIIAKRLSLDRAASRVDVNAIFQELTGASDADDRWSVKLRNLAVEIAEIIWLRDHSDITIISDFVETSEKFDWLDRALPPQHNRHDEQISLQQFSTPARLAWVTARAANIQANDTMLEPSAGTGLLALWPHLAGARLHLNEIANLRRECLPAIFPDASITAHDGELIDELLDPVRSPSIIIMNPPLSVVR